MIAPSIQPQRYFSPFCTNTYNKSATIRHHPHQHHSKVATRRRKHESHRSFKYTRTLDIIPEDQQQDSSPRHCGQHNNKAGGEQKRISNPVFATDFWHSMQSIKKSATSVSLDSLAANANKGETGNGENKMPNATDHIHVNYNGPNVVFDDDYDNFLEDWEL